MKIARDRTNNNSSNATGRSFFNPAAIVLVGSLILLVGAGWLESGGLRLAISGLGAVLLIGALVKVLPTLDFSSPRVVNGTPQQLAWIRIVVCLTALIFTVMEDLPALSSMPPEIRNKDQFSPLLHTVPGYSALLSNSHLLGALQWTTAALLLLGLIGFQTRITLSLGGLGFFLMQAILRDYTYLYHSGLVLVYLVLVISWTACGAKWSVDRWLNRTKSPPSAQSLGFSVYICFIVMAVVYLVSGLSKMRD